MEATVQTGIQLIGNGLETITNPDEFREAFEKVSEAAYVAVFEAQDKGLLKWKRSGDDLEDLITEATVKDGRGEDITIPVIFFISSYWEGGVGGYLMLGSKESAPCLNEADPRVKRLYQQVTGKAWQGS